MIATPLTALTDHYFTSVTYRLAGVDFRVTRDGTGLITVRRPLAILQLNRTATDVLRHLKPKASVAQIAALTGIDPSAVGKLLDQLTLVGAVARSVPPPLQWPSVSIVIPAFERETQIRACALSLLAQDYEEGQREVLVVDDGSPRSLKTVLEDLPITFLRLASNRGPAAARNYGAKHARGQILVFVDSDCEAHQRFWLRTVVSGFIGEKVIAVGARVVSPPGQSVAARFEAVRSPLDMGSIRSPVGFGHPVPFLPSCALAVRRREFLESGGFDEHFFPGEDVDLVWRLAAAGHHLTYEPTAEILHHHRVKWRELLARRYEYGSSEAAVQSRHPSCRRALSVSPTSLLLLLALTCRQQRSVAGVVGTIAFGIPVLQAAHKWRHARKLGVPLASAPTAAAVVRGHSAEFYHFSADMARYHGAGLMVAALIWPTVSPACLILLVTSALADFSRSSAHWRTLPQFVTLAMLECLAYELGLIKGCLEERTMLPLVSWPRLAL